MTAAEIAAHIATLAGAIKAPRSDFAAIFLSAQQDRDRRVQLEAVAPGIAGDTEAFIAALGYARQHEFLSGVCHRCLRSGITEPAFLTSARALYPTDTSLRDFADTLVRLQGIADPAHPFHDPRRIGPGLLRASRQTCRIEIDGVSKGTGFLVAPDIVLTACHVVRDLLDANGAPKPGGADRLRLVFEDFLDSRMTANGAHPGLRIRAHDDWLIFAEHLPFADIDGQVGASNDELSEHRDFVFVQLEGAPGVSATGFTAAPDDVAANDTIFLFQHPAGNALSYQDGPIASGVDARQRFGHNVNTLQGSSGGPCLNRKFELVGIHQGELLSSPNPFGNARNIGIPIRKIFQDVHLPQAGPGVAPLMEVADQFGTLLPVLGRSSTQQLVWQSIRQGTPRILVITGARGLGKSFSCQLLQAMLPLDQTVRITLNAAEIQGDTPEALATRILGFDQTPYTLPDFVEANTTRTSWLKTRFIPDFLDLLASRRGDRTVWIVLDELDEVDFPDQTPLRIFLDALYDAVKEHDWLRFVLLGYRGNAAVTRSALAGSERLLRPSMEDVITHLTRRAIQFGGTEPGVLERPLIETLYQNCHANNSEHEFVGSLQQIVAQVSRALSA